jgi:hypothetical protein
MKRFINESSHVNGGDIPIVLFDRGRIGAPARAYIENGLYPLSLSFTSGDWIFICKEILL